MKNVTLSDKLRDCFDLSDVAMRLGMPDYAEGSDVLRELSNRIDNEYIALPKYEDGKPVHLLDPCAPTDRYGTDKITRLCFTPKGFYFNSSHASKESAKVHKFKYGDVVPRPSVEDLGGEDAPAGSDDVDPIRIERTDTSEQRYQQLEQVVKDMNYEIEERIGVSYREQLLDCGVSLDD